ncbi:MAG TPA: hypothetical protein VGE74_15275 [Gemmata sp.]
MATVRKAFALLLIGVAPNGLGCGKPLAPALELPHAEQIAEMRVSVPKIEGFGAGPISEFVVPAEHVPDILFWLVPAEPDRYAVSGGVESGIYFHVADVMIRTKGGREFRLRCHDWGCNPVAFTPNGKDYYLGHSGDEKGEHPEGCIDGGARLYVAIEKAHTARNK